MMTGINGVHLAFSPWYGPYELNIFCTVLGFVIQIVNTMKLPIAYTYSKILERLIQINITLGKGWEVPTYSVDPLSPGPGQRRPCREYKDCFQGPDIMLTASL